jgi:putative transposase
VQYGVTARRWARHREAQALRRVSAPGARIPPGHLVADSPLEPVQIDHIQAAIVVVDELFRQPIGRPWVSVAIDVATRCVVGLYMALERPNAAIVALLLTRGVARGGVAAVARRRGRLADERHPAVIVS